MTETTKRILDLMQKNNLNAHQLEVAVNLPNASVQNWVKGKKCKNGDMRYMSASTDAITKLARYFNVSADYLLCLTDDPKPLESREFKQIDYSVPAIVEEMPDLFREQRFINTAKVYNKLPDEYRERMYEYIVTVAVNLGINVAKVIGSSRL